MVHHPVRMVSPNSGGKPSASISAATPSASYATGMNVASWRSAANQAYQATRILTPEWVDEVKNATDDLRLRVFEQQYEKATATEIPQAIDLVKRAQFFLLVLDEDTPAALPLADGGEVTSEVLQLVPHDARVRILSLKTGAEVARLRRRAEGGVYGEPTDPEVRDAVRRQVNNCALAMHVAKLLHFEKK